MADEGLRFEAFSMPHVGALTRKFDFSKWVESYTLNDRFNDLCDGTLTMPDDFPLKASLFKIDEANHANDVGSMVRVLRGSTPIMHYLVTRSEDSWSDGEPTHKLALEGLEWILDRCLVPNYDHPADPAKEPDWIYGAPSILQNTDLETSGITSGAFQISVNATAGTFTVTLSAFGTSGAINWNADADAIHTAIEAITGINDVTVSGDGSADNPFVVEVLDPANVTLGTLSTNSAGLTGLATIQTITVGGASITDPWTRSFNPVTGLYHGTYNFFQTSTVQAHGGTNSLYIDGDLGDWTGSFPGAQQIVSVTGGRTYRASVWVYPKFNARYRFVIRTADETLIAAVEADLTANSWQELAIPSVLMPDHVGSVIFRVACIANVHNVQEFYLDDALLAPGFAAATLGKMVSDVRTAAIAVGSPLSWLVPTWSTTLDSDGVAWDSTRQWNVNHGQTFYQLIEYCRRWNYESRIRWDAGDARFEWDMWNPLAGGQARANIAITGKAGVTGSAPIVKRPPGATYVKTEGAAVKGGLPWGEFASTTLDDVWGRLEKFHQDRQGVDSTELDVLAERIITKSGDNTAARAVTVSDPSLLPWTAYEPGDTLTLNLAPKDDKKVLRVAAIVASKGPSDAAPKYDVHFGAPVYTNDTAIASGLRTLIREFRRPTPTSLDGTPVTPAVGGGGAPTVVVAAADSTDMSKRKADFICAGVNDQATIQAALNLCATTGGIVWLCEGVYYLEVPTTGPAITMPPTTALWGVGESTDGAAMLDMSNASDPGRQAMVRMGNHTQIRGLTIYCYDSVLPIQFADNVAVLKVTDCWLEPRDVACIEGSGNSLVWIERNVLVPGGAPTDEDDSAIHLTGNGLVDIWIERNYMSSGWHGIFIDGDQGKNFIRDNELNQMWYSGIRLKNDVNPIFATTVSGNLISVPGQDATGATGDAGIYITADGADIDPTTAQSNGLIVADNKVEIGAAVVHGIHLEDVCLVNCHDNYIEQQGMHGIMLENANACQVHDNTIQEPNTFPTTTFDGIHLVTADDNYIRSNLLVEHRGGSPNYFRYAINVSNAGSDRNIVVGNDVRLAGSGTGFINNAGTGTRVVYPGAAAPVGDNFV